MVPKVFITGVTGYIGGDAFHTLYNAHPDWEYTCLVRNSDKGAQVASQYATVKLVYGDLDSSDLIEAEAKKADIVCHFANSDHEAAANAIATGLAAHEPPRPGYWIHTSGTGNLMYPDLDRKTFGEDSEKVWDDIKDIKGLVENFPDHAPHRKIDKIVLGSNNDCSRTAIVCPPCIYGKGRGPGNQRSMQLPGLANSFMKRGEAFQVGGGKAIWSNVHVHDLSNLYLALAEAAATGGKQATWGHAGYYFAENGEQPWGEVSARLAKKLVSRGHLKSPDLACVSVQEANDMCAHGGVLWGANSRSRASRARKVLSWEPKGASLEGSFDEAIDIEQAALR